MTAYTPGGTLVGYFLDERRGWGLSVEELQRALQEAREEGKLVRGLVFINPGNPTGEHAGGKRSGKTAGLGPGRKEGPRGVMQGNVGLRANFAYGIPSSGSVGVRAQ